MALSPSQFIALLKQYLPRNPWKIIAFALALLNLKSLPFVWHLRLIKHIILTIRASQTRLRLAPGPSTLFLPTITTSRSPPYECDYNLHKSNSTYFSDFDIGRLDLVVALLGKGIKETREMLAREDDVRAREENELGEGGKRGKKRKGRGEWAWRTALGGVACQFRREVKPMEKFEVWTRLLSWDRKWLYLVGHFVKPGSVKPTRLILQPGGKRSGSILGGVAPGEAGAVGVVSQKEQEGRQEEGKSQGEPVIYASAIAKYCFKYGRLTIPPERVLRAAQVLPEKPTGEGVNGSPPASSTPDINTNGSGDGVDVAPVAAKAVEGLGVDELLRKSLVTGGGLEAAAAEDWSWDRVEAERLRGLKIAEVYGQLDKLGEEFNGGDGVALGVY